MQQILMGLVHLQIHYWLSLEVRVTHTCSDCSLCECVCVHTIVAQVGYVAYMPFLQLGENKVDLLPSDDGAPEAGAIQLPDYGFPFWYTNRSTVYVSHHF